MQPAPPVLPTLDQIGPEEPTPELERLPQPAPSSPAAAYAMKAHGIMYVPTIGSTPGGYVFGEFLIEFDDNLTPRLAEIDLVHPSDRANSCDRLRREVGKQIMSSGSWKK